MAPRLHAVIEERIPVRTDPAASTIDEFAGALKRNRDHLIADLRDEIMLAMRPILAEVRADLEGALSELRAEITARDADLSDGYEHLAVKLGGHRRTLRAVVEGLERLAHRLPA